MNPVIVALAQWGIAIPVLLTAAVVLRRRRWKIDVAEALLAGAFAVAAVKAAGAALFEERPFVVEHVHPLIAHAADNAFPSDHLAACGLAFAYLWPRSRVAALITLAAAGAIALARVLAKVHWPQDVAIGFVLGAAAAAAAHAAIRARAGLRFGSVR